MLPKLFEDFHSEEYNRLLQADGIWLLIPLREFKRSFEMKV